MATMIISYSKQQSLRTAIVQTFDGAHPCSLCHVVTKGKNSEQKSDLQSLAPKIDLICDARTVRLLLPSASFDYGTCDFSSSQISHSPLVPPPRLRSS